MVLKIMDGFKVFKCAEGGFVFLFFCDLSYAFGVVDSFLLYSFFERLGGF